MNFYKESTPAMLSRYDIEFFKIELKQSSFWAEAHIHPAIEILYITEGEFDIKINDRLVNARSGDIVLVCSNAIHSIYHSNNQRGQYYVLKFTTQYLFNIFKGAENTDCLLAFLRYQNEEQAIFKEETIPPEIKSILTKMINEYNKNDDLMLSAEKAYAGILIISVFRLLLAKKIATTDTYISRNIISLIYESVEYINLNCSLNITATECAKRANLSYSYYAKSFRLIIGKSFKEYLTAIRLTKAHNLLLTTEIPITEIALACGYNSPAFFTAEYKKHFFTTPGKARKNVLKNK